MAIFRAGIQVACLILLQLHVGGRVAAQNETELHIAFITSFGRQYNSSGTVPALELALEEINNRRDVLPGYNLSLFEGAYGDSQVLTWNRLMYCLQNWGSNYYIAMWSYV